MKPEFNSTRLLGITRSKEKMYEFQIPAEYHINPYKDGDPEDLFYLTIGILGDSAALLNDNKELSDDDLSNLLFAAKFFDSFIGARFNSDMDIKLKLLGAAAYYLINRPGSALVMAKKILPNEFSNIFELTLWQILSNHYIGEISYAGLSEIELLLMNISYDVDFYMNNGRGVDRLEEQLNHLRAMVYKYGSPEELLLIDLIVAVSFLKVKNSSWNKLPLYSNLSIPLWEEIIKKKDFPKELWPSQIKIGEAGLFENNSGLIQMPTSAGKTKSIEIVLQSAFLAKRTKLAIIVAPFRALCNEITQSLKIVFNNTDIRINEISDALQLDFIETISEILGTEYSSLNYVLVLTPEKLLYVLRQLPSLINHLGLLIYDEGHQFDSGKRGITYELLLTEIKALISESTQTILISAVIQNAHDIRNWLIGNNGKIVDGTKLLASSKSIAFASWLEGKGGELHFKEDFPYFVPRIFNQKSLKKLDRERKVRTFPESTNADVALDLAIRLLPQGPVAIYNGLKTSALNIIKRAVEIYQRDFEILPPAHFSDPKEIKNLYSLIGKNFGEDSELAKGANYGFFLHHGTTPTGLRLSIEYAMQKHLIKFISCTSTLAQGVNLPIRYLIVTSMNQAGEKIKVRDFQNLIGRAGRSSMHTEGLIIFADPEIYDSKNKYKYNNALSLLNDENTEAVSSSLLKLVRPITTIRKIQGSFRELKIPINLLTANESECLQGIQEILRTHSHLFNESDLHNAIFSRRKLTSTIESHLMANRENNDIQDFIIESQELAKRTLAYHLANDTEKKDLITLFKNIAYYVSSHISDPLTQKEFSKTLLGVEDTKKIQSWVELNREILNTNQDKFVLLEIIWPFCLEMIDNNFLHRIQPINLPYEITKLWIQGQSYKDIFEFVNNINGRSRWGEGWRKIDEDAVLTFLEQTLAFEINLIISAIAFFLYPDGLLVDHYIFEFQKVIKYGLPNNESILVYELGFSDRTIAQEIVEFIKNDDLRFPGEFIFKRSSFRTYRKTLERYFDNYPSYFQNILKTL
ncbi:DEAD/DEAH box helicase [Acinetobacter sp. ACIN00229]|uniref:DEAD/DEAH box helicase n=1 Tax=Acinetobacter sp. ACIN00229 TaxID=2792607 RepID=UPI0018DF12DD|nr:DEAD/DEAH box helicase [Acinetobacter sp. ACIN00229]MBI0424822.1 DEAD/DEAH box helicase [Acinetobacter sp. ACIN00229]